MLLVLLLVAVCGCLASAAAASCWGSPMLPAVVMCVAAIQAHGTLANGEAAAAGCCSSCCCCCVWRHVTAWCVAVAVACGCRIVATVLARDVHAVVAWQVNGTPWRSLQDSNAPRKQGELMQT